MADGARGGRGRLCPRCARDRVLSGPDWPFALAGSLYIATGVGVLLYDGYRQRRVGVAVRRGEYARPAPALLGGLSIAGALPGVATIILLLTL